MNNSLRIITLLIALLIAGKEVLALGSALGISDDVCWTHQETASIGKWLLENEAEEESDEKAADNLGFAETSVLDSTIVSFLQGILNSAISLREFDFLIRYPEFYIYVLNLRL